MAISRSDFAIWALVRCGIASTGLQRRLFVGKAERNERWNIRLFAKFSGRIPLDPSIEKLPDRKLDNRVISKSKCLGRQRWNRYWHDHHKACGRSKLPVSKAHFDSSIYRLNCGKRSMNWC